GIPILLLIERGFLAQRRQGDLAAAVLDDLAPMLLGLETGLVEAVLQGGDDLVPLSLGEILGVELRPLAILVLKVSRAAGGQQGKPVEMLGLRQVGEKLLLEL